MKFLALPALLAVSLTGADHQTLDEALSEVTSPVEVVEVEEPKPEPVAKTWKCPGCSDNEARTLEFLQERGIYDRAALATVMGNIKSESMFNTNICEGGARVSYENCHSGGFGIVQWTSVNRYRGLGNFCTKYGLDPNSIDGQLRYMVNEIQWIHYEPYLKGEGWTIDYYMRHAYAWLGWSVKGARSQYAHDYYNRMTLA